MPRFLSILTLLLIIFIRFSNSQLLNVYDIENENFPVMSAKLELINSNGTLLEVTLDDLDVFENDINCEILNFDCLEEDVPLSIILAVDNSISMIDKISFVKSALLESLSNIDSESEVSIMTFNQKPKIELEFNNEFINFKNTIMGISLSGLTDISSLFDPNESHSIFSQISEARYKPVVIIITDGINDINKDKVVENYGSSDASINFLLIKENANNDISYIVDQTDGYLAENIEDIEKFNQEFWNLTKHNSLRGYCIIQWQSFFECEKPTKLLILEKSKNVRFSSIYQKPPNNLQILRRPTQIKLIDEETFTVEIFAKELFRIDSLDFSENLFCLNLPVFPFIATNYKFEFKVLNKENLNPNVNIYTNCKTFSTHIDLNELIIFDVEAINNYIGKLQITHYKEYRLPLIINHKNEAVQYQIIDFSDNLSFDSNIESLNAKDTLWKVINVESIKSHKDTSSILIEVDELFLEPEISYDGFLGEVSLSKDTILAGAYSDFSLDIENINLNYLKNHIDSLILYYSYDPRVIYIQKNPFVVEKNKIKIRESFSPSRSKFSQEYFSILSKVRSTDLIIDSLVLIDNNQKIMSHEENYVDGRIQIKTICPTTSSIYENNCLNLVFIPKEKDNYIEIYYTPISEEIISTEIYDLSGKLVTSSYDVYTGFVRFHKKLKKGLYFLNIQTPYCKISQKVFIY